MLSVFLAAPLIAYSATIYVPDNFASIQSAIDASSSGDLIVVREGTYVENIDFIGKAITIESEKGVERTTIDGSLAGSVVTFDTGEGLDSVIEGFTLTNGSGTSWTHLGLYLGGAVYCRNASPTIRGNFIESNHADDGGGIGMCDGSSPLIIDNTITSNTALNGGGISFYDSTPVIKTNTITKNSVASTYGGNGGGILSNGSAGRIFHNLIDENTAARFGGGIYIVRSTTIVDNNSIIENGAEHGSGIYCLDCYQDILFTNNDFIRNVDIGTGTNHALVMCSVNGNVSGNQLIDNLGGGCTCLNDSDVLFSGNTVIGNKSNLVDGGGIRCKSSKMKIVNCLIAGNSAGRSGGGIYCGWFSSIAVCNCTIYGNTAVDYGGGIACYEYADAYVRNSIFWNNDAPLGSEISTWFGPQYFEIRFSDVEGGPSAVYTDASCTFIWGPGMIDHDPDFVDAANDDYHLTFSSPCRNSGHNNSPVPPFDFEGDPRIELGIVDMGADEFSTHLYSSGSVTPLGSLEIKITGFPDTTPVRLALGSGIKKPPLSTPYGDLYLAMPLKWQADLGIIPNKGVLFTTFTAPAYWKPGDRYPFQALVGPKGFGVTRLSNLMVLTVE